MTRSRSSHLASVLLISLLAASCADERVAPIEPPVEEEAPREPVAVLPAGVYHVNTLDETAPTGDLNVLRGILGDAQFVALGETVHTSGGYYQAKFRVFTFLVEQMGFRAFAFETPWAVAMPAHDYVATCDGTPEAAIQSIFTVWQDLSVVELLRWMCRYNQAHPADPVHFYGFDIQQSWADADLLEAFLKRAAPLDAAALVTPILSCLGASSLNGDAFYTSADWRAVEAGQVDEAQHQRCLVGLADLQTYLSRNEPALVVATSADELEWARISLLSLRAFEWQLYHQSKGNWADSGDARDGAMAEAMVRIHALLSPGARTALWAHNTHISTGFTTTTTGRSMGAFLREALGDDYFPLGLTGYRVEINWNHPRVGPPPIPTSRDSVDVLHELGHDYLLVDLTPGAADEFLEPGRTYLMNSSDNPTWVVPRDHYRALLFLDHSWPMTYVR